VRSVDVVLSAVLVDELLVGCVTQVLLYRGGRLRGDGSRRPLHRNEELLRRSSSSDTGPHVANELVYAVLDLLTGVTQPYIGDQGVTVRWE